MNKIACLLVATLVVFQLSALANAKPTESASSSEEVVVAEVNSVEARLDLDDVKALIKEYLAALKEIAIELEWEAKLADLKAALQEYFSDEEIAEVVEQVKAKWEEVKAAAPELNFEAWLVELEEAGVTVESIQALVQKYVEKIRAAVAEWEWETVLAKIKAKLETIDWDKLQEIVTSWVNSWESLDTFISAIVAKIVELVSASSS